MIRKFLTLSAFCLALIGGTRRSFADIEPLQKVQEYMGVVQNNMSYVQGEIESATKIARDAAGGAGNMAKKINEVKNDPLSADEELLNMTSSEIPDINNIGKATEQVGSVYNRQAGQGNDNQAAQEQNEKMMDVQRENVANLYAVAFTTRALLAKERQTEEPENEMEDSRELIKLTNKKALEMAKHFRNIMKLEAAIAEFKISQKATTYSVGQAEEEDSGGEK